MFQVRTDLALEAREKFDEDNVEIKGVRLEEEQATPDIHISSVIIETENGAKAMGKPKGSYVTLEAPNMIDEDEGYHREISIQLSKVLKRLLPQKEDFTTLVVGLGNRAVTPDSLGPRVVDNLCITRHIIKEFGRYVIGDSCHKSVSSIVPGVMAQTGIESMEIVRGITKETNPDIIIAVDALAARSTRRLNRTIQITDTGINPGSGVGNHRHALNGESMGIPVIAVGIPTVVDAATIVIDTMNNLLEAMSQAEQLRRISNSYEKLDMMEKYELVHELLTPQLNTLFVTPKDVDEAVKRLSFTVSEGINLALQKDEEAHRH
ncbi:MAG: GPR endopeptidase [Eubacterium sp.]|nr:GPR endopeptidase [Eubacterium sp.]MCI8918329.1 GPR endopeptidase [Eubacterium sp.]